MLDETFERRWSESAGRTVTKKLEERARAFYRAFSADTLDLAAVKDSIVSLLELLCEERHHTEGNFAAVDGFVCLLTVERAELAERLPPDFQEVLDAIGLDLLDGLHDPEGAARFDVSADILLQRARALGTTVN